MIKNLLFLACTFTCSIIYAQCIPDTDFTGLLGLSEGSYEVDETTVLPHAILGESYETFFDMRIPTDTVIDYDLTAGTTNKYAIARVSSDNSWIETPDILLTKGIIKSSSRGE